MKIPKNRWTVIYDKYGNGVYDAMHITARTRAEARQAAKDWYRFINHGRKHLGIPHRKVKVIQYKLA